jgi:hypothetical protein
MVAVGSGTLNGATGSGNVAVGYNAMAAAASGINNTSVGLSALDACLAGNHNTALGANALGAVTSGAQNVAIGSTAGDLLLTGSSAVVIGYNADVAGTADANSIVIGANAVGAGSNTTVIGVTSTTVTRLHGVVASGQTANTIASAATIAPTRPVTFISGTAAISTITAPPGISATGGSITLIPTGAFTTNTSGNIALASSAVINRALQMTYDAGTAKWYPSY